VHLSRFPEKPARRSAAVITATLMAGAGLLAASATFAASARANPVTLIGNLHHTKVVASTRTPRVLASTRIGSGFAAKADPNALVIGPTGVGLGDDGTLYVADSVNNRIAGIPNAAFRHHSDGDGFTLSKGGSLNDPLGLAIAPNGDTDRQRQRREHARVRAVGPTPARPRFPMLMLCRAERES
jgi:hypothetical protein